MSATGFFEYWMRPRVQCGVGAIIRIPALMQELGARRVLLISDAGLKQAGLVDRLVSVFDANQSGGMPLLAGIYDEVAPDASSGTINAALAYSRQVDADAIVALGGGSVLDAAKAVKYALHHGLADICEVLAGGIKLETMPTASPMKIPHIAVPTTAGTGAEVTTGAVILNESTGIKCALVVPHVEADIAVLDAQLTLGLPTALTADTGMDALTHAVETVASPASNHFVDAHAFTALDIINTQLVRAVQQGSDLDARSSMLQASTMACNAFVNALGPYPVHNCAHAFGAVCHIPHGRANGVLLPLVLEALPEFYLPSARRLAKAFDVNAGDASDAARLDAVISRIRALQSAVDMPSSFAYLEIPAAKVEELAMAIASDPVAAFFPIPEDTIVAIARQAIGQ